MSVNYVEIVPFVALCFFCFREISLFIIVTFWHKVDAFLCKLAAQWSPGYSHLSNPRLRCQYQFKRSHIGTHLSVYDYLCRLLCAGFGPCSLSLTCGPTYSIIDITVCVVSSPSFLILNCQVVQHGRIVLILYFTIIKGVKLCQYVEEHERGEYLNPVGRRQKKM